MQSMIGSAAVVSREATCVYETQFGLRRFFGENYCEFSWSVRQPFALWLVLYVLPPQKWEPVTDSRCLVDEYIRVVVQQKNEL